MSDAKTYVFGNEGGQSSLLGLIAPLLQQRGLDPNMVMAMMNNKSEDGKGGSWFLWILFILIILAFGGNGFGNNGNPNGAGLANLINNDTGRQYLMEAIQGNNTAIAQLATNLNVSISQVQQGINALMSQTQQVGNQVGQSGLQIINAIQSGNASLASQVATACCNNQLAICQQTNTLQQSINSVATGQERGFSQISYNTQQQTCDIQNTINSGVQKIVDGQNAAEMRELNNKIASQSEELSSYKTAGIIAQQLTPINASIAALQTQVNEIKCAQPQTVTLPYSCATAVPTALAAQYGYSLGATGYWG